MAKKVLIISTSLRGGSNSDILARECERGAKEAGHEVEYISLKGKEIKYCIGCLACQTKGNCVLKDAVEMKPGDCVNIPVGVKHWHGAAPDSWFSHLAVEVPGKDGTNEWLEPVTDGQYGTLK